MDLFIYDNIPDGTIGRLLSLNCMLSETCSIRKYLNILHIVGLKGRFTE